MWKKSNKKTDNFWCIKATDKWVVSELEKIIRKRYQNNKKTLYKNGLYAIYLYEQCSRCGKKKVATKEILMIASYKLIKMYS